MKLPSLLNYLYRRPAPKPPTVSQTGVQARAIRHLVAHGRITAWDIVMMGTTDAHKMLTRMRRMRLLHPAEDTLGHIEVANKSGHGTHRVHFWTGKLPASWVDTDGYTGRERRSKVRGCK